jgi:flavin prenyltransferase
VKKIILALTGASGAVYGARALELLATVPDLEIHLLLSKAAERTLRCETALTPADLITKAHFHYPVQDIGARIASGSFAADGMLIAPCSIKTMSEIAYGITGNLIARAADVCLKERRTLILGVRETPFHTGHLKTMLALSEAGAVIAPPVPSFYDQPENLHDQVTQTVCRWLSLLNLSPDLLKRWNGRDVSQECNAPLKKI